jgi:hypothetical protein
MWHRLAEATGTLQLAHDLRAHCDHVNKVGLGVTPLMWWRAELVRLYRIAILEHVNVDGMPAWLHTQAAPTTNE